MFDISFSDSLSHTISSIPIFIDCSISMLFVHNGVSKVGVFGPMFFVEVFLQEFMLLVCKIIKHYLL